MLAIYDLVSESDRFWSAFPECETSDIFSTCNDAVRFKTKALMFYLVKIWKKWFKEESSCYLLIFDAVKQ